MTPSESLYFFLIMQGVGVLLGFMVIALFELSGQSK